MAERGPPTSRSAAGRAQTHLLRAAEELLRAGAEGVNALRMRGDATSWLDHFTQELAHWLEGAEGPTLAALRANVAAEVERWEARAVGDPAAARVRDVFAALAEVLESETGNRRPRPRSAPPRRAERV